MDTRETEEFIRTLAQGIDRALNGESAVLPEKGRRYGFSLYIFSFGQDGEEGSTVVNYVSNAAPTYAKMILKKYLEGMEELDKPSPGGVM